MKRGLGSLCLFHGIPVDHAQSEAAAMMLAHLLNADPFCFHFRRYFLCPFLFFILCIAMIRCDSEEVCNEYGFQIYERGC